MNDMMEDRKKRKSIDQLPPEILVDNILTRLPVESLFRCMCVSKQFHSLITTSTVFEQYYHLHHQKLLFLSSSSETYFRTIDVQALERDLTPARPLPPFETLGKIDIITSYHGLVCLGIMKQPTIYTHLILWNPHTSEYKTLSDTNSTEECYRVQHRASVLYYNSSKDDYMLLRVTYNGNVYIYSLKSNSWRNIIFSTTRGGCLEYEEHWTPSNPMYGIVYFLKIQMIKDEYQNVTSSLSIIRFDIKTEELKEGPTYSKDIETVDCLSVNARPTGGVRIFTSVSNWRWKGTTVECSCMDGGCTKPIIVGRWFDKPFVKWWHLMQENKGIWIMISNHAGYIMKVYMDKNFCRSNKIMDNNTHELLSKYKPYSMYISPRHKYISTYVSPNRYAYGGIK